MKRKGIIPEQGYSLEGMTRTKVDRKSQEWEEGRQVEEGKVIPPPSQAVGGEGGGRTAATDNSSCQYQYVANYLAKMLQGRKKERK